MAQMDNRRKRGEAMGYVMLFLLFAMFMSVLVALLKGDVKSEYGALVGGFGTTILGMFAVAVGYLWGSSKGSQMKDEAAIASQSPIIPKPGDKNETLVMSSSSSGPSA